MNISMRCAAIAAAFAAAVVPAIAQRPSSRIGTAVVMPHIRSSNADGRLSSSISQPSGAIYFGTTQGKFLDGSSGRVISLGLRYDNCEIGVQGLEITIEIPGAMLNVRNVIFGDAVASPADWTLDYSVKRAREGSTVKIIAFGRDTLTCLDAGIHDDLFRLIIDVEHLKLEKPGVTSVTTEMRITGVASALAHSLGQSAGIVAAQGQDVARFSIVSAASRGDVRLADGLDLPVAADAVRTAGTPAPWQRNRADPAPWSNVRDGNAVADEENRALDTRGVVSGGEASSVEHTRRPGVTLAGTPNPFSGATLVRFTIDRTCPVRLVVSDPLGRPIAGPVGENLYDAGEHTYLFDASGLPAGIYFCTIVAGGASRTERLLHIP